MNFWNQTAQKLFTRIAVTAPLIAGILTGPVPVRAQAQSEKPEVTIPSQLGENLKHMTPGNIKACLHDFDKKAEPIIQGAVASPQGINDRDLSGRINQTLSRINGEGPDNISCHRWIKYEGPHSQPTQGCLVERQKSVDGIPMSTQYRYDLSGGPEIYGYFDNVHQMSDYGPDKDGRDLFVNTSMSQDEKPAHYHAKENPFAVIEPPTRDELAAMQEGMKEFPALCAPTM